MLYWYCVFVRCIVIVWFGVVLLYVMSLLLSVAVIWAGWEFGGGAGDLPRKFRPLPISAAQFDINSQLST